MMLQCGIWGRGTGKACKRQALTQGTQGEKVSPPQPHTRFVEQIYKAYACRRRGFVQFVGCLEISSINASVFEELRNYSKGATDKRQ